MKKVFSCQIAIWIFSIIIIVSSTARADENLALYGLKGYAYTYSPLVVDGLHLQTGAMYSSYKENVIECREGYIWAMPISLTYGDGNWWEAVAATHFEYWENTHEYWDNKDFDMDETGFGDLFLAGKAHLLSQERGMPLDFSIMPYMFISLGNRDKSIGDLYLYNPTEDEDFSYGINLLLGYQWERFYASGNLGINYVDTDLDYIENSTIFFGLTFEYQISETMTSYMEFINNENKNHYQYPVFSPCYDKDIDEDIREIGFGLVWVKNKWGLKIHAGAGMTETSPDIRILGLVNRNLSF